MDIVKKNMVSIICGVIALIAVVVAFYPISGWFTDLQQRADTRKSTWTSLRDLLGKERNMPVVALNPTATPEKLKSFPTEAVIAEGNKIKAQMETEAKSLLEAAVKLNQGTKKPLIPDALPGGRSPTPAFNFQREYKRVLDDYDSSNPAERDAAIPRKIMNAGMKPTDADVAAEKNRIGDNMTRDEVRHDDKGRPVNQQEVQAKITTAQAGVADQLRVDAAQKCTVYVDSGSLDVQTAIGTVGRAPPPHEIFWAQISLWLQEDVFRAIAEANAGAGNVMDAAVKRVVKLDIPDLPTQQMHAFTLAAVSASENPEEESGDDGSGGGEAAAVSSDPSSPIQPNFGVSPTGRYSNPLYDVVTFKLSLIVDAERLPQVLQALSTNRFITVFKSDISAVDSGAEQAAGYLYGTRPVVQVDVEGEALFMRQWTRQWMPTLVKRALGVVDPPPASATPAP